MKQVTLTKPLYERSKAIPAIKVIREVAGIGLKEAKGISDDVLDGKPREMLVPDDAINDLALHFVLDEGSKGYVEAGVVLEFVLDVLSYSDPVKARAIMELPSYKRIAAAL